MNSVAFLHLTIIDKIIKNEPADVKFTSCPSRAILLTCLLPILIFYNNHSLLIIIKYINRIYSNESLG